jgi:hypothetical protein
MPEGVGFTNDIAFFMQIYPAYSSTIEERAGEYEKYDRKDDNRQEEQRLI